MDNDDSDEASSSSQGEADALALFSSYYGIQTSLREDDAFNKGDPMSLDAGAFDRERYVISQLEKLKVAELLDKDAQLMHDIRNLDSDMQMLVYENYNKFIAATETIKRMKNNVEDMDTDMSSIDGSMKSISGGSSKLDDSLASKRSKVEKLVRVHRLLERVQFLSSLPETLTKMMDNEQYEDAVQLYKTSSRVLKQYSHILSFQNIEKQCTKMMESLRTVLYTKLSDPFLDIRRRATLTTILSAIHSDRVARTKKLMAVYTDRSKIVCKKLEKGDVALETSFKLYQLLVLDLAEMFTHISPDSDLNELGLFESNASTVITRVQSFLVLLLRKALASSDAALTRHGLTVLQQAPLDVAYLQSTFEEKCQGKVATPSWNHSLVNSFLDILESHLDESVDAGFGALAALVAGSSAEATTLLSKVNVIRVEDESGTEITEGKGMGDDVASVRLVVPTNIRTSISSLATNLVPITEKVVESTLSLLEQLLQKATPVLDLLKQQQQKQHGSFNGNSTDEYSSEHFLAGMLQRFFKSFLGLVAGMSTGEEAYISTDIFQEIHTEFKVGGMAGTEGGEVDTLIASLVCATALKGLSSKVATKVVASVEKQGFLARSTGAHLMAHIQRIGESLSRASALLVVEFIESVACSLSRKLMSPLDAPQSPSVSYGLSSSIISVTCELDRAILALCCLLQAATPAAYSQSVVVADLGGALRRQQASKERIDIDKLFAAPVEIFPLLSNEKDAAPFTFGADELSRKSYLVDDEEADKSSRQSAGCVLMKLALKNAIEVIRTKIVASHHVEQMRGDTDFLKLVCEALIADAAEVMGVFDQLGVVLEEREAQ